MKKVTLVGDIHGDISSIKWNMELPILQIGDFGFAKTLSHVESFGIDTLMILGGNHDEYPVLKTLPSYLGDYGILPGTESTFICRGAYSIDKDLRIRDVSWWPEEELPYLQLISMIELYEKLRPKVMVTHTPPKCIINRMFKLPDIPSRTAEAFDECLRVWAPEMWYFGHMHESKIKTIEGTKYVSLGISEHRTVELP